MRLYIIFPNGHQANVLAQLPRRLRACVCRLWSYPPNLLIGCFVNILLIVKQTQILFLQSY